MKITSNHTLLKNSKFMESIIYKTLKNIHDFNNLSLD